MANRGRSGGLVMMACVAALLAPQSVVAIDGLPVGVELTNTDGATLGWVRVADDAGLEPQQFTIEAWVTPLGDGYGMTMDPWGGGRQQAVGAAGWAVHRLVLSLLVARRGTGGHIRHPRVLR